MAEKLSPDAAPIRQVDGHLLLHLDIAVLQQPGLIVHVLVDHAPGLLGRGLDGGENQIKDGDEGDHDGGQDGLG